MLLELPPDILRLILLEYLRAWERLPLFFVNKRVSKLTAFKLAHMKGVVFVKESRVHGHWFSEEHTKPKSLDDSIAPCVDAHMVAATRMAAARGHLGLLQWYAATGARLSRACEIWAAMGDRLAVLEWLAAECDQPPTMEAALRAAYRGCVETVRWIDARNNGTWLTTTTARGDTLWSRAVLSGHTRILATLKQANNGSFPENSVKKLAISEGSQPTLEWLAEQRVAFTGEDLNTSMVCGSGANLMIALWLIEHGARYRHLHDWGVLLRAFGEPTPLMCAVALAVKEPIPGVREFAAEEAERVKMVTLQNAATFAALDALREPQEPFAVEDTLDAINSGDADPE